MTTTGRHLQVTLLGAGFSTRNMGVGALTSGAIKCVKHRFPDADIFLLDYGKRSETYNFELNGKNSLIQLVNLRFSKKIFLKNNIALLLLLALAAKLSPSKSLRDKIISGNSYLRHVRDSDLIASIAGGDSFSDIYGLGRFFYVALPQLLAIFMDKKLVQLPQTIGPFKGVIARNIARFILNKSALVYSRDHSGLNEAKCLMGVMDNPGKLRFSYDVGFVLEPKEPAGKESQGVLRKRERPMVGLNVSGLLYAGGYSQNNMFGLKTDYRELVHEIIGFLISEKGADVVLVPHVFGGSSHMESDSAVSELLHDELKKEYGHKISAVRGSFDQHEIKHIIGQCDFFIGSRMHACIAALSQAVPTVAVAYSKKFMGVMDSINMPHIVADPRTMDKAQVISIIDNIFENRLKERETLKFAMPKVQERVLELFRELTEVCFE